MTHPILTSLLSRRTGDGLRPLDICSGGPMQAAFSVVSVELKSAAECRLIKDIAEAGCKLHPKASW